MSFFYSDSPEEDDILYGWEFDSYAGRYYRIYAKCHCAPFRRPAPSYQQADHVRPLYVKYLSDYIDEYLLECMFSPFGTVTGSKIFRNRYGCSKGFGFVWFATDREADDAAYWMDGRPIEGSELYVAPAEHWEDRQARLAGESGQYDDDDYEEEDDSYEDNDSYEEEASYRGNHAYYGDRNYFGNNQLNPPAPSAPTAYYDDGRNRGNYQPYANNETNGHGFLPVQQSQPVLNQEPVLMPVYQQQAAAANPDIDYEEEEEDFSDRGNYHPNAPAFVAIYDEGTNGHGYHDQGNSQPVQQPEPAPKQERKSKPVNQQQSTAHNPVVVISVPRGPPPTAVPCCCGTCNTPAQKLKLAPAGCAAA